MLDVIDIHKDYEGKPLLRGISFSAAAGETVCILGPSGGGKSTLLRIIAGLEQPGSGEILWKGHSLKEKPPHKRNFGLMFQDYALFPHRSVRQNIAFGLRMKGLSQDQISIKVNELLHKVNLESFEDRRVTDLSGGEQQRVALARTLAPDPDLLMLDEPLGALDHSLAEQLAEELRQILKSTGTPTLYVTHDQQEAFTIADRILLIHNGKIVQEGAPQEVYNQPDSEWVARFFGLNNLVEGTVISSDPLQVDTLIGQFFPGLMGKSAVQGEKLLLLIRSGNIRQEPARTHPNHLHGRVEDAVFQGNLVRVDIRAHAGLHFRFFLPPGVQINEEIDLYFSPADISCIPASPE